MNHAPVTGHFHRRPSSATRRRPAGPTQPIRRAGVPATRAKAGTSATTTAPGGDHGPRPHLDRSDAHGASADRAASAERDADVRPVVRLHAGAVGPNGAGELVVGQHGSGADEHAVLDDGGFVDLRQVLDLDPVTDHAPPLRRTRPDPPRTRARGVRPHAPVPGPRPPCRRRSPRLPRRRPTGQPGTRERPALAKSWPKAPQDISAAPANAATTTITSEGCTHAAEWTWGLWCSSRRYVWIGLTA